MAKLTVVGLGYIGLPTALMMAASGVNVVGTDFNTTVVEKLKSGSIPFQEKGIEELYQKAVEHGITFTTEYQKADVYIVCVATPYDEMSKKIDPAYVIGAVKNVLEVCDKGSVIVVESTVSPGTMDKYVRPLFADYGFKLGEDIHLVHAPERIIPGNMIYELEYNARTIGADSKEIGEQIKSIYKNFCKGDIEVTDIRTAEMTKVVENTFRDINIAFANELLKICRSDGLDIYEIIRIANKHPRVNILSPGPGVGGHCISVDPWFLVGDYPELAKLIRTARLTNDGMPDYVLERTAEIAEKNNIPTERIGIYGLTYKEDVDDIRDSPTLQMLKKIHNHLGAAPKCYDPMVMGKITENQCMDFNEFIDSVDLIVVMVKHHHLQEHASEIKNKVIFDTRNCAESLKGDNVVELL